MASTTKVNNYPMSLWWVNHKSNHTHGRNLCMMADHLMSCHKGENAQDLVTLTILEACQTLEVANEKKTVWSLRVFSFYSTGLNKREEVLFN